MLMSRYKSGSFRMKLLIFLHITEIVFFSSFKHAQLRVVRINRQHTTYPNFKRTRTLKTLTKQSSTGKKKGRNYSFVHPPFFRRRSHELLS